MRIYLLATLTLIACSNIAPARAEDEAATFVRVYSVADLVVRPGRSWYASTAALMAQVQLAAEAVATAGGKPAPEEELARQNLSHLVEVIETTTVPAGWHAAGGAGRIAAYPETFSLIIRQTEAGHEEVSDLLRQLRAENALSVKLNVQYFSERGNHRLAQEQEEPFVTFSLDSVVEQLTAEFGASINGHELVAARKQLEKLAAPEFVHATETSNARKASASQFSYTPVVSPDRRFVKVYMEVDFGGDEGYALIQSFAANVPAGESTLVRVMLMDEEFLVLVTAEIDIPEEEEGMLQLSQHAPASAATKSSFTAGSTSRND